MPRSKHIARFKSLNTWKWFASLLFVPRAVAQVVKWTCAFNATIDGTASLARKMGSAISFFGRHEIMMNALSILGVLVVLAMFFLPDPILFRVFPFLRLNENALIRLMKKIKVGSSIKHKGKKARWSGTILKIDGPDEFVLTDKIDGGHYLAIIKIAATQREVVSKYNLKVGDKITVQGELEYLVNNRGPTASFGLSQCKIID